MEQSRNFNETKVRRRCLVVIITIDASNIPVFWTLIINHNVKNITILYAKRNKIKYESRDDIEFFAIDASVIGDHKVCVCVCACVC